MSDRLYTKNGKPLLLIGDDVYDARSGRQVGRRRGEHIFGPDGSYAATIVRDRAVYRSQHSGKRGSTFAPRQRGGRGLGNRGSVGISGSEPFVEDH